MNLADMEKKMKSHPDYHKAGMILYHNGVVRSTSRDGRKVTGLRVKVDHEKLEKIIKESKEQKGIIEVLVHINEDKDLKVGDDVMYLGVMGDIRDNVVVTLKNTLNLIKSTVTSKTEFFEF